MGDSAARTQVRQGWIQTSLIVGTTLGGILWAWGKLDAKAEKALDKASNAETKAESVERDTKADHEELVRIRTILEERLPKRPN